MGYLYIIRCNDFYKIGISETSVMFRLAQLQIGNPYSLELTVCYELNDHIAVERKLHSIFASKRARGEWFRLTETELGRVHEYVTKAGGVQHEPRRANAEKAAQVQPYREFGTVPELRVVKGYVMWEWRKLDEHNKFVRKVEVIGKEGEVDMDNPPLPTLY